VCAPLFDDGLIARYFIDEAGGGTAPTELHNAIAPAFGLSLSYGHMDFDEPALGQRGLRWTAIGAAGGASAQLADSTLRQRLDGQTQMTLELVAALAQASDGKDLSRLSHIGPAGLGAPSDLTLALPGRGAIEMYWNGGARAGYWTFSPTDGRRVIHVVLDTDTAARVSAYVDGQPATHEDMMVAPPLEGEQIELSDEAVWTLGNRPEGGHSFVGHLHYAAIYDTALTAEAIEQNQTRLRICDDG